jgi:hypothetical protein
MAETDTARFLLRRWSAGTDTGPERSEIDGAMGSVESKLAKFTSGTLASRPSSGNLTGAFHYVTGDATTANNNALWFNNGSTWFQVYNRYDYNPQAVKGFSTGQVWPSSGDGALQFNNFIGTPRFITTDPDGDIQVQKAGLYFVSVNVTFQYGTTSQRAMALRLLLNGNVVRERTASGKSSTSKVSIRLDAVVAVNDNDSIGFILRQEMGSNGSQDPGQPNHTIIITPAASNVQITRIGR